jgi:hypothetical protein
LYGFIAFKDSYVTAVSFFKIKKKLRNKKLPYWNINRNFDGEGYLECTKFETRIIPFERIK